MASFKEPLPSSDETWRIFRIMAEFVEGFEKLSRIGPCVTIFGSARTPADDPYFQLAVDMAKISVANKYGVITGGGPGIMEAANKGAKEAGGVSVGLNIQLPYEQYANPFVKTLINFRYFFIRKVMFLKYTSAVIVCPGGFGTLDEMFETLTLVQTHKIPDLPVILLGREFWGGMIDWLKEEMLRRKYINAEDMDLFTITDDPEEAIRIVNRFYSMREREINFF